MFKSFNVFMLISLYVNIVQCGILSPCHVNDSSCFEKSLNEALPKLLSADPSLGIESSDPLNLDQIEGNLTIIHYKFINSVTEGFKNCLIKDVKINMDALTLHFKLDCPGLEISGKYKASGRLIILPVEGDGDFYIKTGRYTIVVDSELKEILGDDGKTYIAIKNIKLKNEPKGPIKFDFKNLFNGQKDLSDAVIKFANENWKEVADLVQDPVWYASLKKIISNFNKYLKTEPKDEIFIP